MERVHPALRVKSGGDRAGRLAGLRAAADLDERQQVDRVERMTHDETLGMGEALLKPCRQQPRGRRPDHHLRSRGRVDLGQHAAFKVFALGQAFLHEIDVAHGIHH